MNKENVKAAQKETFSRRAQATAEAYVVGTPHKEAQRATQKMAFFSSCGD